MMKRVLSAVSIIVSLIGLFFAIFVFFNNGNIIVKLPLLKGPTAGFVTMNFSSGMTFSILIASFMLLALAIVLNRQVHN